MSGPYCQFCGRRCFLARVVPGVESTMDMATCSGGMARDRQATGYDHTTAINPQTGEPGGDPIAELRRPRPVQTVCTCLMGSPRTVGGTDPECPAHGRKSLLDPAERVVLLSEGIARQALSLAYSRLGQRDAQGGQARAVAAALNDALNVLENRPDADDDCLCESSECPRDHALRASSPAPAEVQEQRLTHLDHAVSLLEEVDGAVDYEQGTAFAVKGILHVLLHFADELEDRDALAGVGPIARFLAKGDRR